MKFLETITFFGNSVLVPIDRIEYVMWNISEKGIEQICIKGEGQYEWIERFDDEDDAKKRFEQIKKIMGAS